MKITPAPFFGPPAAEHAAWTKAALSTRQADPFCCAPTWQLSFHEAFSPSRRLIIKEDSPDSVILLAETIFPPNEVYLTPIEAHWFFGCPLPGRRSVEYLSDMLGQFEEYYASPFTLVISGIRPGGAPAQRLIRFFGAKLDISLYGQGMQCAASLAGGMDGFLSRRSGEHRHKLKKEARRARERGVYFERVRPDTPENAQKIYSRILLVESASWKGLNHCGMLETPVRQFYNIMLQRLSAAQNARIIFARYENQDIGFIFGGMAGKIYRGQQFSYNVEWKNFSIGNLLQVEQIHWLCEEGAGRYDMGPLDGDRMAYKQHWTEKIFFNQTWLLRH